jgi:hypothetical protein
MMTPHVLVDNFCAVLASRVYTFHLDWLLDLALA